MMPEKLDIYDAAFSGNLRALKRLIEDETENPNVKDSVGHTPLHKACMNGWLDCVKYLVEKGANTNSSDVSGCTPLHYAAANGYVEVARFLIETAHASMTHKTNKGHTARYMAKSRAQTKMVAFFNEMENKRDGTSWLS